jgi:antitoxin (DNA-binding transcriptional repressor) of toxin-antitoxin stability system
MTTINVKNPSPELAAALAGVAEGVDCVIETGGTAVAVMISPDEYAALRAIEDAADLRDVMQVRAQIAKEGTVSLEEIKKRYAIE